VEVERRRLWLGLNRTDVQMRGRRDASFGDGHHVVDGRHHAGAADHAGRELGRFDRGSEFRELGPAIVFEAIEDLGEEDRQQLGECPRV
jgi:hypothetical protein